MFHNRQRYPFDEPTILRMTPPRRPGVYGLFANGACIYVGKSENAQARLLEHLRDPSPDIRRLAPTHFTFEYWPRYAMGIIEASLIEKLHPPCNGQTV